MEKCKICTSTKDVRKFMKYVKNNKYMKDCCDKCIIEYIKYKFDIIEVTENQLLDYKKYGKISFKNGMAPGEHGYGKNNYMLCKYNISLEDYNKLFLYQEGRCAICNKHQTEFKKALSLDHDHNTNIPRGILCNQCNVALGLLKDDIENLKNAIKYLENPPYNNYNEKD